MKSFLKIICKFLTIFLVMILFILHLVTHLSYNLTTISSKDKIQSVIENFDIDKVLVNGDGFKSEIYASLEKMCIDSGFSEQQTYNTLHSKTAKYIIGQVGGLLTETILGNRSNLTIDGVKKILRDNFNTLLIEIDINITEEEKQETLDYFNEYIDNFFTKVLIEENVIEGEKDLKYIVDILFSGSYKFILLGSIIVVTGLIALCQFSLIKSLKISGIVTLISSIIMLLIGITPLLLSNILINVIGRNGVLIVTIIKSLVMTFVINGIIGIIIANVQILVANRIRDKMLSKKAIISEKESLI